MAEIVVKVGTVNARDERTYQDGDIIAAFNNRRISQMFVEHICDPRKAGGGRGILRDENHVSRDWFEHTHQYCFERVNRQAVRRVDLATGDEVLIGERPSRVDGRSQHTDVVAYINRRLAHHGHKIYGQPGREFWYGGKYDPSLANIDLVWTIIESKTAFRRFQFRRVNLGISARTNLAMAVDDFGEARRAAMETPSFDLTDPDEPVLIRKRRHFIPWRDHIPSQRHAEIEDKTREVDLRENTGDFMVDLVVRDKEVGILRRLLGF